MKARGHPGVTETGSALLLCLVLLTGLTLLGLAAASDYQLQLRIQANLERSAEAGHAADMALDWAERWLFNLGGEARPAPCQDGCGPGAFILDGAALPQNPELEPVEWWLRHGQLTGYEPVSGQLLDENLATSGGRWLIERIDTAITADAREPSDYYRIIARGESAGGRAVAVVESIVLRPWSAADDPDPLPLPLSATGFCQRAQLYPCGRVAWRRLR